MTDFVTAQQRAKTTRLQQANGWCADWNAMNMAVASFADRYSTL